MTLIKKNNARDAKDAKERKRDLLRFFKAFLASFSVFSVFSVYFPVFNMDNRELLKTGNKGHVQLGFTLLELIIVMLILGMTAALIIPNINIREGVVLKAQAREVISRLRYARRSAVIEGKQKVVILSQGQTAEEGEEPPDTPPPKANDAGHWVSRHGTVECHRALDDNKADKAAVSDEEDEEATACEITFFPEGGSSGGEIILSDEDYQIKITVNLITGKIKSDLFGNEDESEN